LILAPSKDKQKQYEKLRNELSDAESNLLREQKCIDKCLETAKNAFYVAHNNYEKCKRNADANAMSLAITGVAALALNMDSDPVIQEMQGKAAEAGKEVIEYFHERELKRCEMKWGEEFNIARNGFNKCCHDCPPVLKHKKKN